MAFRVNCPSCGAPVVFRSAASLLAVCEFCDSTLVRHDQDVEDIGKMAQLAEDRSPLQLGSEGKYQGVGFALVGRLQLRYERGLWNEWYLLFDDQRTGWLSEANGEYVLTFPVAADEPLPLFDKLVAGQRLSLLGRAWTVSNVERAECVAGEGELPFRVAGGYAVPTVDLRSGKAFATLDYSESPPLLFVGEAVALDHLRFSNLRQADPLAMRQLDARTFRCPGCGSALSARSADILSVGCASCGAVIDTADKSHRLASAAMALESGNFVPQLALGSKGVFEGKALEVIGYMVRACRSDGQTFDWEEYLLVDEQGGYRWLVQEQGHWNLVDVLADPPLLPRQADRPVSWRGQEFRHFSTTREAEVIYVIGEFNWRVRRGDRQEVIDYVAPPQMLSCERSANDLSWSRGIYLAPAEVSRAFALPAELPAARGVYTNQPNPWQERFMRSLSVCFRFLLIAVVLHIAVLLLLGSQRLLRQEFSFSTFSSGEQRTQEFNLPHGARKLRVRNEASIDNTWVALDLLLVHRDSGTVWPAAREISYYHGNDGGESWSEGRRDDEVSFSGLPPGNYYLTIDPELAPEIMGSVQNRLVVSTGGANWSNFVLLVIFLLLMPGYALFRSVSLETRRWAESDHAPVASEDEDDE